MRVCVYAAAKYLVLVAATSDFPSIKKKTVNKKLKMNIMNMNCETGDLLKTNRGGGGGL